MEMNDYLNYGLIALGSLIILASVVIKATPTTKDDEAWEKLKSYPVLGSVITWLEKKSLIKPKDE